MIRFPRISWGLLLTAMLVAVSCTPVKFRSELEGPVTLTRRMDYSTGGFRRSYRLHIPAGDDGGAVLPLVVVVHGAFDTAKGMERFTGFSRLADRERFYVLYPNGIGIFGFLQHWNAGHCCGKAAADDIDDVGFLSAAIEDAAGHLPVDRQRIYMVGFSNGGMMTYRFAAERGDVLAAAAALAASIGGRPSADGPMQRIADPVRPLPMLIMHGMSDDDIPYDGGLSRHRGGERTHLPVDAAVRFWVEHNGCTGPPTVSAAARGAVEQTTWKHCQSSDTVTLYRINGWGHMWPGPYFTDGLPVDDPLHGFDAAEVVWDFFKRFPSPP